MRYRLGQHLHHARAIVGPHLADDLGKLLRGHGAQDAPLAIGRQVGEHVALAGTEQAEEDQLVIALEGAHHVGNVGGVQPGKHPAQLVP